MTTLRKRTRKTMQNITNLNEKCGDVRYCIQLDKRVYALHCLHCSQVCLQWDTFINHMEQEHGEDLYLDPVRQPEDDEMEIQIENDDKSKKSTLINDELNDSDHSAFDDLLESEDSSNPLCLQSSLKIENVDCSPNLTMFDYINTAEPKHTEADKNNSEFTVNLDQNTKINNQEGQDMNFITIGDLNNFRSKLKEDLQKTEMTIRNQINEQPDAIKRILVRVLQELRFIKADDKTKTISILKANVIPDEPFSSIEDFLKYEKAIKTDEEKYHQLLSDFVQLNANCFQNYIKLIWRKVVNDGAAQHMCWKGTDRKTPVRSLAVTQALKAACIEKYPVETELNFEKVCILHFQHAKGRHEKKLNYKNKARATTLDNISS